MIKDAYREGDYPEVATRKAIFGAYLLYGSFVTLFVWLLQLLGVARSN
jgi:FtsH-binding integral membrane protein